MKILAHDIMDGKRLVVIDRLNFGVILNAILRRVPVDFYHNREAGENNKLQIWITGHHA